MKYTKSELILTIILSILLIGMVWAGVTIDYHPTSPIEQEYLWHTQ